MEGRNPREGCAALVLRHYRQRRAGVARIGQTWLPDGILRRQMRRHNLSSVGQRSLSGP